MCLTLFTIHPSLGLEADGVVDLPDFCDDALGNGLACHKLGAEREIDGSVEVENAETMLHGSVVDWVALTTMNELSSILRHTSS